MQNLSPYSYAETCQDYQVTHSKAVEKKLTNTEYYFFAN